MSCAISEMLANVFRIRATWCQVTFINLFKFKKDVLTPDYCNRLCVLYFSSSIVLRQLAIYLWSYVKVNLLCAGLLKNMHNGSYKISGLPKFCIASPREQSIRFWSVWCLCTFDFILTDRFIMWDYRCSLFCFVCCLAILDWWPKVWLPSVCRRHCLRSATNIRV